ncbi:TROVE domain-containing protein [Candidatus Dependentiae bacterium]|nr:TROVE domain-containing protein [Candidatus Dependentiae bacterium]
MNRQVQPVNYTPQGAEKNMKYNDKPTLEKTLVNHPGATVNNEGALAFDLDALTDLCLKATVSLVGEPKFYETAKQADSSLITATHKALAIDPEFVLQLAVYCREKMYLRSVPLMLVAEYANVTPGTVPNARKYIARVIQRADELTELVSYQFNRNKVIPRKSKLPMALKFGIASAFNKFNAYKLAKYNNPTTVTLRDVLRLTRPKPTTEEQAETFNMLFKDTLPMPKTWELMRMTGQMTWHDVVNDIFNKNGKVMNYMAQIRNIRSVMNDSSITNEDVALMAKMISDKEAVLKSKQLPFRFLTAYRIVMENPGKYANIFMDALETAITYSTENMPKLTGTTLIASDVSASMQRKIATGVDKRGNVREVSIERYDIGILLGMIANTFCENSITGLFGDTWKPISTSKHSGILSNTMNMHRREGEVGYSTNGYKIIKYLLDNNISVERIFIFTDGQFWNSKSIYNENPGFYDSAFHGDRHFSSEFMKYQRKNPNVKLYVFDLAGYGKMFIPQDVENVCMMGGWSDKIFNFIEKFETDPSMTAMVDEIRKIEIE